MRMCISFGRLQLSASSLNLRDAAIVAEHIKVADARVGWKDRRLQTTKTRLTRSEIRQFAGTLERETKTRRR
jgi:hypothetical protein